jgi:hypothetical protein
MLRHFGLAVAAAATITLCPDLASASVRYDFTSFSVILGYTGSFTYDAPTFITSNTTVPAGSMSSCTVTTPGVICTRADFGFFNTYDQVGFATDDGSFDTEGFYYFDSTAFVTPGVHNNVLLVGEQDAQLTVSIVPEPSIWVMMLLGFGGLGAMMRAQWRRLMLPVGQ